MNLASPRDIRRLLMERGLRPNRALGQNFLIDRNILDAIVAAAALRPDDHALEVGPGLGVLTDALLAATGHVTAVEMDAGLHAFLKERWGAEPRLTLQHGDALELDPAALLAAGVTCLIANLPYAVGTRVVVAFATPVTPLARMVVLVQREVAERFTARPRTPDMGPLAIWLQQAYAVEIVRLVKPTCFWPKPAVVSALVRLRRHAAFPLSSDRRQTLMAITRIAFQHRRKQLATLFREAPAPHAVGLETVRALLRKVDATVTARPEELSVSQWCRIAQLWPTSGSPEGDMRGDQHAHAT